MNDVTIQPQSPPLQPPLRLSLRLIFRDSFALLRDGFWPFLLIVLVGQAFNIAQTAWSAATGKTMSIPLSLALSPVLLVLTAWIHIALLIAAQRRMRREPVTAWTALVAVKGHFWRYALYSFLSGAIIFTAATFFLAPGIIAGVLLGFAPLIAVLSDVRDTDPLQASYRLVLPFFWKVLALMAIVSAAMLALMPATLVLMFRQNTAGIAAIEAAMQLVQLYLLLVDVVAYRELKRLQAAGPAPLPGAKRLAGFGCLICLGLDLLLAALLAGAIFLAIGVGKGMTVPQRQRAVDRVLSWVSPPIRLPDSVSVPRPEGYWVTKLYGPHDAYRLMKFGDDPVDCIYLRSIPRSAVCQPDSPIFLTDGAFEKRLFALTNDVYPYASDSVVIPPTYGSVFTLNGNVWGEYTFKFPKPGGGHAADQYIETVFLPSRQRVLVVTFDYEAGTDSIRLNPAIKRIVDMLRNSTIKPH
ncbi:MAG TPA: hypothetical protein VMF29_06925 [Candidatus Edwardsbacteria bacterium]|nr:hypothetical protein [Candidatus Edwardsbacteria bacterium]